MFNSIDRILEITKKISVIIFFLTLSYSIFEISKSVKNIEYDLLVSSSTIRKEIPILRESIFGVVDDSVKRIDRRISSVEKNLFSRVDTIESKTFKELEKTNNDIHHITLSIDSVTKEYNKVPGELFKLSKNLEPNINCEINDYCWPNLVSDLLIDSRNMVRDGSKTFALVNNEVPKFTSDINKVSTSLAIEIPKVSENTTKITDNINRLTKPKWYDRLLGVGANATLIYYNIGRR
jgi:hypothetical protein